MLFLLLLTSIFIGDALLTGYSQAHYYDMYPSSRNHPNIHWAFLADRSLMLLLIEQASEFVLNTPEAITFVIGLAFIYSFFHNGMYYSTRHKLNPRIYPAGFFSDSEGSTAVMEFSYNFRTSMLMIGIAAIMVSMLSIN